jgi:5'-nucleotidase
VSEPHVLVTNDDGIDAPGLRALRDAFADVARVTVVAPAEDRSGAGAARSREVRVEEREDGYAVYGTPADCAAFGLRGLDDRPGLVVSGCNHGPNFGGYVLTRSGTVGAAMEASFLGAPAVAVSAYHPREFFPHPPDEFEFAFPARVARELALAALSSNVFAETDVVNLNVPVTDAGDPDVRVTRPVPDYDTRPEMEAVDGGEVDGADEPGAAVSFRDTFWATAETDADPPEDLAAHRDHYPEDSGRAAVIDGDVSVMPLAGPHAVARHPDLDDVVASLDV